MRKQTIALTLSAILLLSMMALPSWAQLPTMSDVNPSSSIPAGPLPEWDVASIKPHSAEDQNSSWMITADGLSLINLSLKNMICNAWDLKLYQVSGLNGWMENNKFDLTAKVSSDDIAIYKKLGTVQRRVMLQKLLRERFQLEAHMETKTLPLYNLVVDKSGSKLKPSTAIDPPSDEERKTNPDKYKKGNTSTSSGRYEGTGVTVMSLASQLAYVMEKPVHDLTGLTGIYDINLHFRSEDTPAGSESSDAPSIFSALQEQLGLKVLSSKGPVDLLVVEAAQKPEPN